MALTSKEKAAELLEARRKRRQKRFKANKLEAAGARHLDGKDWRHEATLERLAALPVLVDDGSGATMLAGSVLQELIGKGAKIKVRQIVRVALL